MCVCVCVCVFISSCPVVMGCDIFTQETMTMLSAFSGSSDHIVHFCLEGFPPSHKRYLIADFQSG